MNTIQTSRRELRSLCFAVAVWPLLISASASISAGEAIPDTDALREKYPEYRTALTALGEENIAEAIAQLTLLSQSPDAHLAADATFFLGRALVMQERFEAALPHFEKLHQQPDPQTTHLAEARYLRAMAQLRLLRQSDALQSFQQFLRSHPDAPERMKVDAERQIAALETFEARSIRDVQHHMDYSRRRLTLEDAGSQTQDRQQEIIAMLDDLIKENEEEEEEENEDENEDESSEDQQQQQQQGGKQKGKSGKNSPGPSGTQPGSNHQSVGDAPAERLHNPGSRAGFGDVRDRERAEQLYGALKTRFPARYRELVEQYYKNLQEEAP